MTGISDEDWRSDAPYLSIVPAQQVTYDPFTDEDLFAGYATTIYPCLTPSQFKKCAYLAGLYLSGDMKLMDHMQSTLFLLAINLRSHNNDQTKVIPVFRFALSSKNNPVTFMINGKNYDQYLNDTYAEMIKRPLNGDHMKDLLEPLIIEEKNERIIAQLNFTEMDKEGPAISKWIKFLTEIKASIALSTKAEGIAEKYANYIAALSYSMFQGLWKNKISVQQAVVNSFRGHLSRFLDMNQSDSAGLIVNSRSIDSLCLVLYDRSEEAKVLIAASYMVTLLTDISKNSSYVLEAKYMVRVLKAGCLIRAEYFGMALLKLFMVIYNKTKISVGNLINALSIGPFERIMATWFHTIKAVTLEYKLNELLIKVNSKWGNKDSAIDFQSKTIVITKPMGWIFARLFNTASMGQFRPSESPQLYLAIAQCALKLDPTLDINDAYAYKQYSQQDMTIAGLLREALLNIINDYSALDSTQDTKHKLPAITEKMIANVGSLKLKMASDPVVLEKVTDFSVIKKSKFVSAAESVKIIKAAAPFYSEASDDAISETSEIHSHEDVEVITQTIEEKDEIDDEGMDKIITDQEIISSEESVEDKAAEKVSEDEEDDGMSQVVLD